MADSTFQLTDATLVVNNEPVGIDPNSLKFTEGLGEQKIRVVSTGGGKVEQIYSRDLESNMSKISFTMPTTVDSVKLARQWKTNANRNVLQVAGSTPDGDVTRTFTGAALTNDYEVPIGSEGSIELQFMARAGI